MVWPPDFPEELSLFTDSIEIATNRPPIELFSIDESMAFHASRLALLIHHAGIHGKDQCIDGRTKLAKLDFFVRYPVFLARAISIAGTSELKQSAEEHLGIELQAESHMIRYRYGPWDHRYYNILAYMFAKQLISSNRANGVDNFRLEDNGTRLVQTLLTQEAWTEISIRCSLVGRLFAIRSGTYIKEFVYRHFPEVVHTTYSSKIMANIENRPI